MNQRTHSWIAIRAIALLEDEGSEPELVELLKPHARMASVGAWIPDDADAKRGGAGASTENHVLKMEPYHGAQTERFTTSKDFLTEHVGSHRVTAQYLKEDATLNDAWWAVPYRGDVPKPGQHLPNRIMGLSTMMKDLLLMGDREVDALIPGDLRFARYLHDDIRTAAAAAAAYYFMLSHFVADICMPCHCDARKLSAYGEGLHKELEAHWSRTVGTAFEKKNLCVDQGGLSGSERKADSEQILAMARFKDDAFGVRFSGAEIPDLHKGHDIWLEAIHLCRASFAIASIIAPCDQYPYGDKNARALFDTVLGDANPELMAAIDHMVMHDAVLNTALFWKHIWNKVSKE